MIFGNHVYQISGQLVLHNSYVCKFGLNFGHLWELKNPQYLGVSYATQNLTGLLL